MPWLKIDDGFISHPKIAALTDGELRLWMRILCFSASHRAQRNGLIAKHDRREIPGLTAGKIARFTALGLLDETDQAGVLEVHDFSYYNPSRDIATESARLRQELFRDPELRQAIRRRDGDTCRYCAKIVAWNDRKSLQGGTYDHVDPERGNTAENVVVCCRSCNSMKGRRTPEQAKMRLLPPPQNQAQDLEPDLNHELDPDLPEIKDPRARARSRTPTPLKAAAVEGPLQDTNEPSLDPDNHAAAAETDEDLEALLESLSLPGTLRDRARQEPDRAKAVAAYTIANRGGGAYFRTVFDSGDHPAATANGAASSPAEWCDRFVNGAGHLLPVDELEYQLREHGAVEADLAGYLERASLLRAEPSL